MTGFVMDASVTLRWVLESEKLADQDYAWWVLARLDADEAVVPSLWYLEVSNVLLGAEKGRKVHPVETERFLERLQSLRIREDAHTSRQAFVRTLSIARAFNLSSYDAAYLELAVRTALPISTLDRPLRRAARRLDVPIFSA